jgi:hypothetical protein
VSACLDLVLDGDSLRFRPGDWVRGHVAVLDDVDARDLRVTVRFRERSPDYTATVREISTGELHTGDVLAGQKYEFSVQIPADALPTFSSANGALYWDVEARLNQFGVDTTAERRIDVSVERAAASSGA